MIARLLLRVVITMLACVSFSATLSACEICDDDSHGEHTHVWCDFPPDNSWGFDECYMTAAPGGGEMCRTGVSQCYYTETSPGGGDGGGGGDGWGSGGDPDCYVGGARNYCPPWCAVCNLEP